MGAVSEEVDLFELLVRDVPQAEGLVPSIREDVKEYLSTYQERKAVVRELFSKYVHEGCAEAVLLRSRSAFLIA